MVDCNGQPEDGQETEKEEIEFFSIRNAMPVTSTGV
jgi:hypothetical protein